MKKESNIYWCEYIKQWNPPVPCPEYMAEHCKVDCKHRPEPKSISCEDCKLYPSDCGITVPPNCGGDNLNE